MITKSDVSLENARISQTYCVFRKILVNCFNYFSNKMRNLQKKLSIYSFETTCEKISEFLKSKNISVFTIVDHRENAVKVGLTLRPEKVIFFGSPLLGTHLMEEDPDIGLELPSKVLVYQENDLTYVVHRDYNELKDEFQLTESSEYIEKLANLMKGIDNYISAT